MSTPEIIPEMTREEFSDMIQHLASYNEKLFKWEQALENMEKYPDSDGFKKSMQELIEFINLDKSTSREKAIYLYGQLAQQCCDDHDYARAAKAYERAAALRFEQSGSNDVTDPNVVEDIKVTIRYLEGAITAYSAMGKHKHVGTLHYKCSRMLRLIGAPHEVIIRHCRRALESFTSNAKHHHTDEFMNYRDPIENKLRQEEVQKIWNFDRDKFTSEAAKYCQYSSMHEASSSNLSHTISSQLDSLSNGMSKINTFSVIKPFSNGSANNELKNQESPKLYKTLEERVESAKKLVKKLKRFFPYYEVITEGSEAGRVWCKICERHLGAVSSTLKNHVNTQEHKEAFEELNLTKMSQDATNYIKNPNSQPQPQQPGLDFDAIDLSWLQPQQIDPIPMMIDLPNLPIQARDN